MDFKHIHAQLNLSKKAVSEMQRLNRIFDSTLSETVKGAPEEHKPVIEKLRIKSQKAIRLAKEGKAEEAQKIIKELNDTEWPLK